MREYFEKPLFSYPPLIILPHIWFLLTRIFYRIIKPCRCCCNNDNDDELHKTKEKVFSKKQNTVYVPNYLFHQKK